MCIVCNSPDADTYFYLFTEVDSHNALNTKTTRFICYACYKKEIKKPEINCKKKSEVI